MTLDAGDIADILTATKGIRVRARVTHTIKEKIGLIVEGQKGIITGIGPEKTIFIDWKHKRANAADWNGVAAYSPSFVWQYVSYCSKPALAHCPNPI